jgi:hypothetical protein
VVQLAVGEDTIDIHQQEPDTRCQTAKFIRHNWKVNSVIALALLAAAGTLSAGKPAAGRIARALKFDGLRRVLRLDEPPEPMQFAVEGRITAMTRYPGTEVGINLHSPAAAIRGVLAYAGGTGEFQVT